ncbi:MAG: hypothetical protein Fur0037_00200 [Planctomycetota bacterium]
MAVSAVDPELARVELVAVEDRLDGLIAHVGVLRREPEPHDEDHRETAASRAQEQNRRQPVRPFREEYGQVESLSAGGREIAVLGMPNGAEAPGTPKPFGIKDSRAVRRERAGPQGSEFV